MTNGLLFLMPTYCGVAKPRETRSSLKILFITGDAENVAIARGFLQPGMEMITKPFDLDNLSQRIREMVSG